MKKKFLLYGPHPNEVRISMDLCRESITEHVEGYSNISVWPKKCLDPTRKIHRLKRILAKYLFYPLRVFIQTRITQVDVVHFLDHSNAHLIPYVKKGVKIVVTLHDIIPLRYADGLSSKQINRYKENVSHLKKATTIISVSEYSKSEAISLLSIDSEKITVIPNGVKAYHSENVLIEAETLRNNGAEIIVFSVGSVLDRKNLQILPDLLEKAEALTGKKIGLLRAGAMLPEKLICSMKEVLGASMIVELGRISVEKIWDGYASCDLVIIPSLYEGFGLPLIEALAAGKSVLSSNTSSLPEVGGDMVKYFSPSNITEGAEKLHEIIKSLPSAEPEINARINYANQFSWENHFLCCLRIYDSL